MSRIPTSGHPAHTRMLEVELLADRERPDDRLEVRGSIVDLRKTGFVAMLNDIQSAGFVHHMKIGLAVRLDDARVEQVRVEQPYVAIEASTKTGGECCRDPMPLLLALEGEHLVPGFEKEVSKRFGGPLGCSHLLTLGQTLGRALPHAIGRERAVRTEHAESGPLREAGERIFKRTVFVDGLASEDGARMELALQQSDISTTPWSRAEQPMERLDRQHEIQGHARIAMNGFQIETLTAQERLRCLDDLDGPAWQQWHDRSDEVADLAGERVMPGLGGRLFAKFGAREELRVLLDALLHLGPGFLQCIAAMGDGLSGLTGDKPPPASTLGGMPDSCYMWRSDGALEQRRQQYMERFSSTEDEP